MDIARLRLQDTLVRFAKLIEACSLSLLGPSAVIHIQPTKCNLWLQVRWSGFDSKTGKMGKQHGRKWLLSIRMTDSEVVQTAFMAVMAVMEHETREDFKYKGHPIFCPHYNVQALALLHNGMSVRDTDLLDARPNVLGS